MKILTNEEVVDSAVDTFRLFSGGRKDILPIGLAPVDRVIGGLFGGAVGLIGADTGVGKSSLLLSAVLSTDHVDGVISAEDMADVVGSRALAARSGVDSLKLRRPKTSLTPEDMEALSRAQKDFRDDSRVLWAFPPRKTVEGLRKAARALVEGGAKFLWLDYIQKFRGTGLDRRNEVGSIFTAFQEECQAAGVPGMALSQFKRRESDREPRLSDMKESGDLENECRLAVLAWADRDVPGLVNCRIAKSTYGGGGVRFQYQRDGSGTLREVGHENDEW